MADNTQINELRQSLHAIHLAILDAEMLISNLQNDADNSQNQEPLKIADQAITEGGKQIFDAQNHIFRMQMEQRKL